MQIQQYIYMIRDGWWIILSMLFIFLGLGIIYSYSQTPQYDTEATFVLNPTVRIAETYDLLYSIDTLAGRTSIASTYSNILGSQIIIDRAAQLLDMPPDMLSSYDINVVVLPDSSVLLLRIEGPSPYVAADLANAMGTIGVEYVKDLNEIYEIRRLDTASPNLDPISPNHTTDIVMSIIVGLAGGFSLVFVRHFAILLLVHPPPKDVPLIPTLESPPITQRVSNVRSQTATATTTLKADLSPSQSD